MTTVPATSDLYDRYSETVQSCDLQLRQFGGVSAFEGKIVTFHSDEDNLLLKSMITEPGHGKVLVIDTAGSVHVAMIGDNMAGQALENGWAGLIINGSVRDVAALAEMPIGIKALGANPRRSLKDGGGKRDAVVSFGGATFTPGAHLVSDDDGIVVLPLSLSD